MSWFVHSLLVGVFASDYNVDQLVDNEQDIVSKYETNANPAHPVIGSNIGVTHCIQVLVYVHYHQVECQESAEDTQQQQLQQYLGHIAPQGVVGPGQHRPQYLQELDDIYAADGREGVPMEYGECWHQQDQADAGQDLVVVGPQQVPGCPCHLRPVLLEPGIPQIVTVFLHVGRILGGARLHMPERNQPVEYVHLIHQEVHSCDNAQSQRYVHIHVVLIEGSGVHFSRQCKPLQDNTDCDVE